MRAPSSPAVLGIAAVLAATALPAAAHAAAPRFERVPYLARFGAQNVVVAFDLNKPADLRSVTIAGERARVRLIGHRQDAIYNAVARDVGRLAPGRKYWVRIRVCSRGDCTTRNERLYLHRRFAGKGEGALLTTTTP